MKLVIAREKSGSNQITAI